MDFPLVFFDLETSGFGNKVDVLQIAMTSDGNEFNEYIEPTNYIPQHVTRVNNLSFRNGELYYKDTVRLATSPQHDVVQWLLQYLQGFREYPCVLVAHNCTFDSSHLMRIIREERLEDEFSDVIAGFTDTLAMLRRKYPDRRSKGQLKLITLAQELSLDTEGAHDAKYDVQMLEQIALYHFSDEDLVENRKSFDDVMHTQIRAEETAFNKETLQPLRSFVSKDMVKKMAAAGISYNKLIETYNRNGTPGAVDLLQGRVHGIPQVIRSKKMLNNILDHLEM